MLIDDRSDCNPKAKSFQSQSLELLREVNTYLERTKTLDPVHKSQHFARLDYVIGFDGAFQGGSQAESSFNAQFQVPAKETALKLFPDLEEKIVSSHEDDVLFAIKALERKSSQEQVYSPEGYFETVLEDRRSKREEQRKAA